MFYDWAEEKGPEKVQEFIVPTIRRHHPHLRPNTRLSRGRLALVVSGDFFISLLDRYGKNVDYGITYLPLAEGTSGPTTW